MADSCGQGHAPLRDINAVNILTLKISEYQAAGLHHVASQSDPIRERFGCLQTLAALPSETRVSCSSVKSWLTIKSGLDVSGIPTIRVYVCNSGLLACNQSKIY